MKHKEEGPVSAGPFFIAARTALDRLDRVSRIAIVTLMGAMTVVVSLQVLLRYGFNSSIDSADELARLFFIWAMFLAIPHGIRRGIHVGIQAVINRLPPHQSQRLFRLNCLLAAALMFAVFSAAVPVILGKWDELMPTIELTASIYYIAVLFSAGHGGLHLLLLGWAGPRCWEGFEAGEGRA